MVIQGAEATLGLNLPFLRRLSVACDSLKFILGDAVSLFKHESQDITGPRIPPGCLFLHIGKSLFRGLRGSASSPKSQDEKNQD
jgi:hypothetical protein